MYEERRAFPFKWVLIAGSIVVLIIGIIAFSSYRESQKKKAYDDLLNRIREAGVAYGQEKKSSLIELEEMCIKLDELIDEGFLKSDSKKEAIILNPKTNRKMSGYVKIWHEEGTVDSEYLFDDICEVDYEDRVILVVDKKTTHSFIAKIEGKELKLNSFEYKIDDEKFFTHDAPEYRFDGLMTGNHKITVKATDYLGNVYEREAEIVLDALLLPEIILDSTDNSVTVNCPTMEDEAVICAYTIDSDTWVPVNEETKKYIFKENGKIIAQATDGYNTTDTVTKEVTVIPSCIDTTWSVCGGCVASCGNNCEGTQTSNCNNTRACQLIGNCASSTEDPTLYTVTVKASNGSPVTQSYDVMSGFSRVFVVRPDADYVYSSVKCTTGSASYLSKSGQLTVSNVTSPRTCNVYFTKKIVPPTTYTVTFYGFGGQVLDSKTVTSGQKVSPITAPVVAGYTFVSWTKNGTTYNFDNAVTSNLSLTANYVGNRFTVAFNSNGGSTVTSQYIIAGERAYRPADPARTAYHFRNWTLNGNVYSFDVPVTGDINLLANWAPLISKTVNFDGTIVNRGVTLPGYIGLHQVTSSCPSGINYEMTGITISIQLNQPEVCSVSVIYY